MIPKVFTPEGVEDNAVQQSNGQNYQNTFDAGNVSPANSAMRLVSHQTAGLERHVAIRFPGTIVEQGTVSVPSVTLSGYTANSSDNGAEFDLYLEAGQISGGALTTNPFPASVGVNGGTDDIISRTTTSGANALYIDADPGSQSPFIFGDLITDPNLNLIKMFKELMISAGAEFNNLAEPLIATTPTQMDIDNVVFILKARSASPTKEIRIRPFEWGIETSLPNIDPARGSQIPRLTITTTLEQEIQTPSDKRTHIALLTDSFCFALQPGKTYDYSFVSYYLPDILGGLNEDGVVRFDDVPSGAVSFVENEGTPSEKAYSIQDPDGLGNGTPIMPNLREGFTPNGWLKDVLLEKFNVSSDDIIVHAFGLGGSTAYYDADSNEAWSSATPRSDTYQAIDELLDEPDLNAAIDGITNPLWKYVVPKGGGDPGYYTPTDLLMDSDVERLLVIYIGGGNDFFNAAKRTNTSNHLLPVDRDENANSVDTPDLGPAAIGWPKTRDNIKKAYLSIARFCHGVRQAGGGSDIEFMIAGYPNFPTDEPIVEEIKVNEGLPATNSYHWTPSGTWPSTDNPEAWYGGEGETDGYMSPRGGPNPIPHIPWFLDYTIAPARVTTNVPNYPITDQPESGPLPRPINKYDLGFNLQIKAFAWVSNTWNLDYSYDANPLKSYRLWYTHWAADHFGYLWPDNNVFDPTVVPSEQWGNSYNALLTGYTIEVNGVKGAEHIDNYKIWIPYGCRNINNKNINEGIHYVCQEPAEEAVEELATVDGINAFYVEQRYCHTPTVGLSDPNTASAGTERFFDSIHMNSQGSKEYCEALIENALPKSEILQTLTDLTFEAKARFMPFVTDAW